MQFSFILNLQKNYNNLNTFLINTDAVSIASDMFSQWHAQHPNQL